MSNHFTRHHRVKYIPASQPRICRMALTFAPVLHYRVSRITRAPPRERESWLAAWVPGSHMREAWCPGREPWPYDDRHRVKEPNIIRTACLVSCLRCCVSLLVVPVASARFGRSCRAPDRRFLPFTTFFCSCQLHQCHLTVALVPGCPSSPSFIPSFLILISVLSLPFLEFNKCLWRSTPPHFSHDITTSTPHR